MKDVTRVGAEQGSAFARTQTTDCNNQQRPANFGESGLHLLPFYVPVQSRFHTRLACRHTCLSVHRVGGRCRAPAHRPARFAQWRRQQSNGWTGLGSIVNSLPTETAQYLKAVRPRADDYMTAGGVSALRVHVDHEPPSDLGLPGKTPCSVTRELRGTGQGMASVPLGSTGPRQASDVALWAQAFPRPRGRVS